MALGSTIKDAYKGYVRTGTIVEDLDTHWRVDWGPNKTKVRKDRVGNSPKNQGPWFPEKTKPSLTVAQWEERWAKLKAKLDEATPPTIYDGRVDYASGYDSGYECGIRHAEDFMHELEKDG